MFDSPYSFKTGGSHKLFSAFLNFNIFKELASLIEVLRSNLNIQNKDCFGVPRNDKDLKITKI